LAELKKITVEQLECNRCFYKWFPRITREGKTVIPKTCPNTKCKSPYWNKERVFKFTFGEGKIHSKIIIKDKKKN
jgi:hypothetical protein